MFTHSRRGWAGGIVALSVLVSLYVTNERATAAVIYQETFTGQLGKGAIGPGGANPTVDLEGVTWELELHVNMTAADDFIHVRNPAGTDEVLSVQDPGGQANWLSPIINIAGFTDVQISIDMESPSVNYNKTSHEIQFLYSIDGGDPVEFFNADDYWGDVASANDFIPTGVFSSGILPPGNTLRVIIATHTSSGVHSFRFDDITVTGVPEPASALVAAFGMLFLRRRKR